MPPIDAIARNLGIATSAAPLALVIYLLLVLHARSKDSPAAGDDQLGLKTVAASLIVSATAMTGVGTQKLLHLLLTFDNFAPRLKAALPELAVGVVTLSVVMFVFFPRTNVAQYPKAKRLAAGAIAVPTAGLAVGTLAAFIGAVLAWPNWSSVADAATTFVVATLFFAIST